MKHKTCKEIDGGKKHRFSSSFAGLIKMDCCTLCLTTGRNYSTSIMIRQQAWSSQSGYSGGYDSVWYKTFNILGDEKETDRERERERDSEREQRKGGEGFYRQQHKGKLQGRRRGSFSETDCISLTKGKLIRIVVWVYQGRFSLLSKYRNSTTLLLPSFTESLHIVCFLRRRARRIWMM